MVVAVSSSSPSHGLQKSGAALASSGNYSALEEVEFSPSPGPVTGKGSRCPPGPGPAARREAEHRVSASSDEARDALHSWPDPACPEQCWQHCCCHQQSLPAVIICSFLSSSGFLRIAGIMGVHPLASLLISLGSCNLRAHPCSRVRLEGSGTSIAGSSLSPPSHTLTGRVVLH